MGYLYTGEEGTPLSEIIKKLGNKSYSHIECRILYKDNDGEDCDEFFGCCSYDSETGILSPLDGDSYSLDDRYVKWEEVKVDNADIKDGIILCVWESGRLSDIWEN